MKDAILVYSGGMDSTTLLYYLIAQGIHVTALSFDYGQRHKRELDAASMLCKEIGVDHHILDITSVKKLLKGSSLTDDSEDVPHGHYAAENMKTTVVPNRNAMMLSIAYAHAVSSGASSVYFAAHAGDHFIYPDCRPPFVRALEYALQLGNDSSIKIEAPFINMTKGEIAALGSKLNVPYDSTWTCYEGGDEPCGKCGACTEREEAFQYAEGIK